MSGEQHGYGLQAGHVLAERTKGAVRWVARISADRGRLEVLAVVAPSATPTEVALLTEGELMELLGEPATGRMSTP